MGQREPLKEHLLVLLRALIQDFNCSKARLFCPILSPVGLMAQMNKTSPHLDSCEDGKPRLTPRRGLSPSPQRHRFTQPTPACSPSSTRKKKKKSGFFWGILVQPEDILPAEFPHQHSCWGHGIVEPPELGAARQRHRAQLLARRGLGYPWPGLCHIHVG